jgi:hypothetical protein
MNNDIITLPDGVPVNNRVQHATEFFEITDEQRQAAIDRNQRVCDEAKRKIFGGTDGN